ncbi:MAG TPA: hypothetical protein VGL11_14565 [Candidatus Binatia bacterium]
MKSVTKKSLVDKGNLIGRVKPIGAIILGLSENRPWIELCYDGDLMHTKRFELPADATTQIFVEEIPHRSTIFEPPRTMIYLDGPCEIEIVQEGNHFIVRARRQD